MASGAQGNSMGADDDREYAARRERPPPFTTAAANGRVDIVKLLLAAGARVDAVDSYRWTPLRVASLLGRTEKLLRFCRMPQTRLGRSNNQRLDTAGAESVIQSLDNLRFQTCNFVTHRRMRDDHTSLSAGYTYQRGK